MSPIFSSYYDTVDKEDFDLLVYLSSHVIPFTWIIARNHKDIRQKLASSTSWCHLAARAVATVFADKGIEVVDGQLYDFIKQDDKIAVTFTTHSWCRTRNGSILDVAPVGVVSFMPLLFAKRDNVKIPDWGFVADRYLETPEVNDEIREHLRSPKFRESFPVYVSVLKNARKKVDTQIEKEKANL